MKALWFNVIDAELGSMVTAWATLLVRVKPTLFTIVKSAVTGRLIGMLLKDHSHRAGCQVVRTTLRSGTMVLL
jgi:hypothetical protein